jgi:K(+)-stimulated pyrophosphate-energized sodium pump
MKKIFALVPLFLLAAAPAFASEVELHIPDLNVMFNVFGMAISGTTILGWGMLVALVGMAFGLMEFMKIKKLPAHKSLLEISELIYETCKTYLMQQGKFLVVLELFIGACIFYYFFGQLLYSISQRIESIPKIIIGN